MSKNLNTTFSWSAFAIRPLEKERPEICVPHLGACLSYSPSSRPQKVYREIRAAIHALSSAP